MGAGTAATAKILRLSLMNHHGGVSRLPNRYEFRGLIEVGRFLAVGDNDNTHGVGDGILGYDGISG